MPVMMRCVPFAFLLIIPATAAPVPKVVLSAEQEAEFNRLWDTRGERASAQLRYYCRLVGQPDAGVEYIRRLVKPAEMSEKEAKALIADLGSKDEITWKKAFRDLRYRDVRLAMTLSEAWDEAKAEVQRVRLAHAMFGLGYPRDGEVTVSLLPPDRGEERWRLMVKKEGSGSVSNGGYQTFEEQVKAEIGYDEKAPSRPPDWVTALERINTPAARVHLGALTGGRDGAKTTRYAKAALDRLKNKTNNPTPDLDAVWRWKWYEFTKPDAANVFLEQPNAAVKFLKTELRPVKLTAEGAKKLLAQLFDDDKKEVLAAVRELQVVDLQLEMEFADMWAEADTATKRCRLVDTKMLWVDQPYNAIRDDFDIDERNKLRDYEFHPETAVRDIPNGGYLRSTWRAGAAPKGQLGARLEGGQSFVFSTNKGVAHIDRWYHEESAIYILDAIGTDEAIGIIKDIATGHPDAGPTKVAKDILKRRGVK